MRQIAALTLALAILTGGGVARAQAIPVPAAYVNMKVSYAANPCLSIQACVWRKTDGHIYFSISNVDTRLDLAGSINSGFSAITTGVGNTHEYLDVTLGSAFSAATGASGYFVDAQISLTTSTDPGIIWWVVNKTTTGFRINFSGDFNGEVRWRAY